MKNVIKSETTFLQNPMRGSASEPKRERWQVLCRISYKSGDKEDSGPQKTQAARCLLRKTTSLTSLPRLYPDPMKTRRFLRSLLRGGGVRKPEVQL